MIRKSTCYIMPESHCLIDESDKIIIRPLMDLVESGEGLFVYCNLPGVAQKDLELTVDKDSLYLRGQTGLSCLPGKVQALEFGDVVYEARLSLPITVDASGIEASLREGVLTVFLPFPRKNVQRIPVTQG